MKFFGGSRPGLALVAVHFALVVYSLAAKPADLDTDTRAHPIPIAGRAVVIPDEGPLLKTIIWLDLPSLIGLYVLTFFYLPSMSNTTLSWIVAAVLFVFTFIQWWLIGSFLERIYIAVWKRV